MTIPDYEEEQKRNRTIKLSIAHSAKIMCPHVDSNNRRYYKGDITCLRNRKDIIEKAPALFIHTYGNEGIVIDFADWHQVKFYDVRANKTDVWFTGDYYIIKETSFSANRGVPRLHRVFSLNGKKLGRVEFYKAELMFLGAIAHTQKALYYIYQIFKCEMEADTDFETDAETDEPLSGIPIEACISGYKNIELLEKYIQKNWINGNYVIKSMADKNTDSLADIALVSKGLISKGKKFAIELGLTEGPGEIKGYERNTSEGNQQSFKIKIKRW